MRLTGKRWLCCTSIVMATSLTVLSGCSLNSSIVDNSDTPPTPPIPIIKDKTLYVTPSLSFPYEKIVYWGTLAGVAYLVIDPFSPNWEIQEARMPENYIHFQLSMKRFYSGGAGEARVVFHRRAKELMRAGGFGGYEVIEYNEGMESSMLGGKRNVEGVIRLVKTPA